MHNWTPDTTDNPQAGKQHVQQQMWMRLPTPTPDMLCCGCCCGLRAVCSTTEAAKKHPRADVFVNYASFRRCAQTFQPLSQYCFDSAAACTSHHAHSRTLAHTASVHSARLMHHTFSQHVHQQGLHAVTHHQQHFCAAASLSSSLTDPSVPVTPPWRPCGQPPCVWWLSLQLNRLQANPVR